MSYANFSMTNIFAGKSFCGPTQSFLQKLSFTGEKPKGLTGSWTYRKPVCGPIGNRFEDLTETGLWT